MWIALLQRDGHAPPRASHITLSRKFIHSQSRVSAGYPLGGGPVVAMPTGDVAVVGTPVASIVSGPVTAQKNIDELTAVFRDEGVVVRADGDQTSSTVLVLGDVSAKVEGLIKTTARSRGGHLLLVVTGEGTLPRGGAWRLLGLVV